MILLASSGGLVRILRPSVEVFVLAMFDARHDLALCRSIRAEFVGDHDARCPHLLPDQSAHKTLGGGFVPAALDQNISSTPF